MTTKGMILVVLICLTACANRQSVSQLERDVERAHQEWLLKQRKACFTAKGACLIATLPDLSLKDLARKGPSITIDCDLDFIDYTETTAQAACEQNIHTALNALVARFPEALSSVPADQFRYELTDEGCIETTDGYCACTFSGFAVVPLVWKH